MLRYFNHPYLHDFVRLTVGTREHTDLIVQALATIKTSSGIQTPPIVDEKVENLTGSGHKHGSNGAVNNGHAPDGTSQKTDLGAMRR
jgi:hypothetical protein